MKSTFCCITVYKIRGECTTFADRLKSLRMTRGESQEDVAKALGISQSRYQTYESNKREPNSVLLIKIAKYFGVSTDYLLGNFQDSSNIDFSISKAYSELDEHGKKAVDAILKIEYERCQFQSGTNMR